MRIGIDAHIILPQHKRYNPKIAEYTDQLVTNLLKADKDKKHTWVLFFDQRMKGSKKLKKYEGTNVEIKHFPFVYYRKYLPVVYSHMLISSYITAARLDVFHSPEGLIPMLYPGRIVTTFHYVPHRTSESNLFVRTFMLGARVAFSSLCKRAKKIIVNSQEEKARLIDRHGCKDKQVVIMNINPSQKINWQTEAKKLLAVYKTVARA